MNNIINFSDLKIEGIHPKFVKFPDGEFKVALEELEDHNSYVLIVQTDKNPMEKIFATAMLVDIVNQRNPSKIIVVHPWLSFSRQDKRFLKSEPLSIDLLLKFYLSIGVTDIISCDIHTVKFRDPGVHNIKVDGKNITIHNLNVISSLYDEKFKESILVSPTGTDEPFLQPLRDRNIRITYFKKEKFCHNCNKALQLCLCSDEAKPDIRIATNNDISGKNIVIVDDIIAGGGTMLSTVKELRKSGANDIKIIVTHAFFNNIDNAMEIIENSSEIFVSNSVTIPEVIRQKIKVIDISNLIKNYLSHTFN